MPYVQKDENGLIVGLYAKFQKGTAEEFLEGAVIDSQPSTQEDYSKAIQEILDNKALSLGYDNIFTGVTYADEPGVAKFQIEGQALRKWRSLCWEYAYAVLAQVQQGSIEQPTIDDFILGMPNYE